MKLGKRALQAWLLLTTFVTFNVFANLTPIAEFTKDMLEVEGYYDFYYDKQSGKLFLKIEREKKPFLFQSSLPSGLGSNDIGLDRGQLGDTRIVQFERHGNKVLLVQLNTNYRASSENRAEQKSVEQAFAKSVIQGFEIKSKYRGTMLIDYTDFLLSDIHGVSRRLSDTKQGSFKLDKSRSAVYFARSKSFPKNTELESIVSFTGSKPGKYVKQVAPDPRALTVHLHHSLIELPDDNYRPRRFHPFSGYWSIEHKDYAVGLDDNMAIKYIPRHRLFKKNPNAERSEVIEPIVYYLDPGAPEPVRTALLDGARWWNEAFEAAGFIDAFQVKMLPPHADPMDVRYNTIQWVHRATRGWSYGSSVIDPRTGEIIKGHVTLGSLRVRQDYLIAQGLTGPFNSEGADTNAIKDMALARIRQLSAHEVGHTLGIAHNFSASMNNRASVMDYPHPLVSIVDDSIDLSNAYAEGIGEWDKHVVKYGYSHFNSDQNEVNELSNIIAETRQQGLLYMSDPDARPLSGAQPEGHLWDNGNDAANELSRVLKVRQLALSQFGADNLAYDQPFSDLQEVLIPIYLFHRFQVTAAAKLIGGVDYAYDVKEGGLPRLSKVGAAQQQAALDALLATLSAQQLTLPEHILSLIPPKAYGSYKNRESAPSKTGLVFDPIELASANISHTLKALLNPARLNRLAQQGEIMSPKEYLSKIVERTVKLEPAGDHGNLVQQRTAALVLESLVGLMSNDEVAIEVKADVYAELGSLNTWLQQQSIQTQNAHSNFFSLANFHLGWYLEHRKWLPMIKSTKLPPGSPI